MIRLLECTDSGHFSFTEFDDESRVPAYAILSHTWSPKKEDEVLFGDIVRGHIDSIRANLGYEKLRFCCQQVRSDEIRYFWIDTCCIDKKNSVELNEAIISMFRWYQKAAKCYVYLSDVSGESSLRCDSTSQAAWKQEFRDSRWFTRGWTLQELLAPMVVEFFSKEGSKLGDKGSLEQLIHESTKISVRALRATALHEFTVDERMSWTRGRRTSRPEDMLYCLLGIFDVTLIPMYGEGLQKASQRLNDEIKKAHSRGQKYPRDILSEDDRGADEYPVAKRRRCDEDSSLTAEQVQDLLESLKFKQIEARRLTIKSAHARTCRWFIKDPQYLRWLDNGQQHIHHGFFWIKGKPGSGKSTLIKFALDHAHKVIRKTRILSFFFNARGHDLEKSVAGAYRTLLTQLLAKNRALHSIFDILGPCASTIQADNQWEIETLKDLLIEAFRLRETPILCYIDALDECDEEEVRKMISFLESICEQASSSDTPIRICLASRHYPNITPKYDMSLTLEDKEEHQTDILNYLQSELKIGHTTSEEQIRDELVKRASGVFIWIALVVGILNKEYDKGRIHALRQRLAEIPDDIHKLFHDILSRDDHGQKELALCIQWVLFTRQPLTAQQLYFAINSGCDNAASFLSHANHGTAEDHKRFVLDASKGLTEITKGDNATVQFIHESVRDFFLKQKGYRDVLPMLRDNFEGQSQETLKQCCASYVDFACQNKVSLPAKLPKAKSKEASDLRDALHNDLPFLEYAAKHVLHHADRAAGCGIAQDLFLQSFKLPGRIAIINAFEKYDSRRHDPSVSDLFILAEENLPSLIRSYSSPLAIMEREKDRYGTPLLAALSVGSVDAARVMLEAVAAEKGVDGKRVEDMLRWLQEKNWQGRFRRDFEVPRTASPFTCLTLNAHGKLVDFFHDMDMLPQSDVAAAFQSSVASRDAEVVLRCLDARADANAMLSNGGYVLHLAIGRRPEVPEIIKLLLDKGADPNLVDASGDTALHLTISRRPEDPEIVKLLLDKGADPNLVNASGNTALHLTVGRRPEVPEIIKLLLDKGADPNLVNASGDTALSIASAEGLEEVVQTLLDRGALCHVEGHRGKTPLSVASSHGQTSIVTILLYNGAKINFCHHSCNSALYEATFSGHEKTVRLLIQKEADPNLQGGRYGSALQAACSIGREDIVSMLLQAGADPNLQGGHYGSALQAACFRGSKDIVSMILQAGADPNLQGGPFGSALRATSFGGSKEIVSILLQAGADVDAPSGTFGSALRIATG